MKPHPAHNICETPNPFDFDLVETVKTGLEISEKERLQSFAVQTGGQSAPSQNTPFSFAAP
jgi:hypothetical protein